MKLITNSFDTNAASRYGNLICAFDGEIEVSGAALRPIDFLGEICCGMDQLSPAGSVLSWMEKDFGDMINETLKELA